MKPKTRTLFPTSPLPPNMSSVPLQPAENGSKRRKRSKEQDTSSSSSSSTVGMINIAGLDSKTTVSEYLKQQQEEHLNELLDYHAEWREKIMAEAKAGCEELREAVMRAEEEADDEAVAAATSAAAGGAAKQRGAQELSGLPTVKLAVIAGAHAGLTFEVKPRRRRYVWIGRSTGKKFKAKGTGVSLPEDHSVSTTHAKLGVDKDGFVTVTDLQSTNGTLVNDVLIEELKPHVIKHGDALVLGDCELNVQIVEPADENQQN